MNPPPDRASAPEVRRAQPSENASARQDIPVWTHPGADLRRTQRMFFRRRIRLGPADDACLRIYADSRYRLFINGKLLIVGPVRSVWWVRPMFDTIDLAAAARDGCARNGEAELFVEVLCLRANNFQNMPGSPGGLCVWGRAGEDDLADGWEVCLDPAWHYPTPHHSFAQGPTEVADLRLRTPSSMRWVTPVRVEQVAGPEEPSGREPRGVGRPARRYGAMSPADLPPPRLTFDRPVRGWDLGLSVARELRVGVAVAADPDHDELDEGVGDAEAYRSTGVRPKFAYAMFVHSPRPQRVDAGVFWGPHYLNGLEVTCYREGVAADARFRAPMELREGWNLLYGELEFFGPVWGVMNAFPLDAGLVVRGRPELHADSRLRTTPLLMPQRLAGRVAAAGGVPADAGQLERLSLPWREVPLDEPAPFPAREVAWDVYDPSASSAWDGRSSLRRVLQPGEVWSVVADFGTEYLGLVEVDVEGPAGVTVDVAYEERRRSDGAVELFSSNPFCEMAERFVLVGGRARVSPVQPRGGRLVQVTFRMPPDAGGTCTLHELGVRDVKRPAASCATLASSDSTLDWAVAVSRHTIERTLEDGYVDPWRERGLYLGDAYVAGLAHLCTTTDVRHVRHAIRLFAEGQRDDGQFPCVVPAYLREPHEDFSLIYADFVWQYVRVSADVETGRLALPAILRMLEGSRWVASASGLWDTHRGRVFLDWGVHPSLRVARENACINALRYRALLSAAALAESLAELDLARRWRRQARDVARAFRQRLWLDGQRGVSGGFSPGSEAEAVFGSRHGDAALPPAGEPLLAHTVHANVLALFAGIFDGRERESLTQIVEREMSANAVRCRTLGPHAGMVELYFLRFAVEALTDAGRPDVALRVIREHFGLLQSLGLVTLPEAIHRAVANRDSLCHCWGGWPLEWVTRRLMGVGLLTPLDPAQVVVAPLPILRDLWPVRLTAAAGQGQVEVELDERGWSVRLDQLVGGALRWAGQTYQLEPGVNRGAWV